MAPGGWWSPSGPSPGKCPAQTIPCLSPFPFCSLFLIGKTWLTLTLKQCKRKSMCLWNIEQPGLCPWPHPQPWPSSTDISNQWLQSRHLPSMLRAQMWDFLLHHTATSNSPCLRVNWSYLPGPLLPEPAPPPRHSWPVEYYSSRLGIHPRAVFNVKTDIKNVSAQGR